MDKETKLYASLAYCSLFCLAPLLKKTEGDFLLFHGRQGLALFLCEMAVFLASIVFPVIMKPFLFVFVFFSLWGVIKVLQGDKFKLPIIFSLSQRLVL